MTSTKRSAEREALRARIQRFGLRCTAARLAVLGELQRSPSPLSHAEIARALASLNLDRATVYRNLMELSESGLVSRLDLGDHVWRFERKKASPGHKEGHPHFVCTDCGEVSCLPDMSVKVVAASGAPKALGTRQVEVQVKGRCDDCT